MSSSIGYQSVKGHKDSIGVLDIGSSKISCFIAEPDEQGELRINGIGHTHAKGIRGGTITDGKAVEQCIISAVNMAEKMAGVTLDNIIVCLSPASLRSRRMEVELNIGGNAVTDQDIADMLREACQTVEDERHHIVHCFVTRYQLDGAKNIRDPRAMYGMQLKASIHIITIDRHMLINFSNSISRCHLDITEYIVAPYAAGLGCLQEDERELGVTVIDMGATDTGYALFNNGALIFCGSVPVGGAHVTKDLAQGLSTGLTHAERIKTLHGSVLASAHDDQHMVHIPPIGEQDGMLEESHVPRSMLVDIIYPRIDELFNIMLDQIDAAGMSGHMGHHIVLTGGASQLVGVRELALETFGKQVRIGKPALFPGLAESVSGPAFTVPIGMLHYVLHRPFENKLLNEAFLPSHALPFARIWHWIKANF